MEEQFNNDKIEEMLKNSTEEIVEGSSVFEDEFGNRIDINEATEQAEKDIRSNFRCL